MTQTLEIRVPNIGDFRDVPIVDVLVRAGDTVALEDPLVALESEKATMEVPSPHAGVVRSVIVKVGDTVSEGSALITLDAESETATPVAAPAAPTGTSATSTAASTQPARAPQPAPSAPPVRPQESGAATRVVELRVPDIGDFQEIPVIDVAIAVGDRIEREAPLVTLESEKAAMDVPASAAGVIREVRLKIGDRVSMGTLVALLEVESPATATAPAAPPAAPRDDAPTAAPPLVDGTSSAPSTAVDTPPPASSARASSDAASSDAASPPHANGVVHASPSIRRFARELGVDLHAVRGTGPHARITRDDVQDFVKSALAAPRVAAPAPAPRATGTPFDLPAWPKVDFAKFGPVESVPLSRVRKLSGPALHRNWISIPHVTNNDEADITELEAFRKTLNAETPGARVTMLAFVIKALVVALRAHPDVNSSLDGETLVRKGYYNIGFAADTPQGLMVPVLHGADVKGILAIAAETAALAAKARDGKLAASDMQGASFTVSSLGGIGGTSFTPIVNAPEVAILGLSRSTMKPVWNGAAFVPRLMLPLSLSYDHRAIDGALAARFNATLAAALGDLRRALL
ncbi:MAG: dihydrolipoyllysine-residue acetyltransferase [Vulcanimicrobiaceae bacterium]